MSWLFGEKKTKITIAEKIGPGSWSVLHSLALGCDDFNIPETFITVFVIIINGFKCIPCRIEAIKYINKYSPSNIIFNPLKANNNGLDMNNIRSSYPCSHYINTFHNFVNRHLGKPTYDLSRSIEITKSECKNCEIK